MSEDGHRRTGGLLGLLALLALSACSASNVAAGAAASPPPAAWATTQYDRESAPPIPEDPYETLPKLRYKLAPGVPVVSAKAGAAGSGSISVSWVETWLGRGTFSGFGVRVEPNGPTTDLPAAARDIVVKGLASGTYTFSVIAHGQYLDETGVSGATRLLPAPPPPVVNRQAPAPASNSGYLIDVNLTTQSMVAYHNGQVFISSPITSGRPGYRSPVGTFYTSTKYQHVWFEYHGLYTPQYVKYAIRFWGLYYLHTWDQPALSDFGPGSQNGPYASLGCIEMPDNVMAAIYSWAPYGTAVRIHY